ncbi:hypothetical protein KGM_203481 [Danaus plexippus plexippus]|uniref:Uncharacterized protein n=1 Tax=Danaus plexippus plexippus TaxID=278856 RepID=A0A212FKJ0_DANPL|nr:hypothetical protein KGM_203481 [Danaus plexippus plexippus]
MSRVINRSRENLKAVSTVTRHEAPTATQLGAKPSSSNISRGAYRELPTVLKDYVPELSINKSRKSDVRVKPKKTLESLDPATSPLSKIKSSDLQNRSRRIRGSAPSLVNPNQILWSDSHYRQCLSSRSHTKLKELKDEIKEFEEKEKLLKIRSHLYKKCGIVLNDAGQVSADKAVQVQDIAASVGMPLESVGRTILVKVCGGTDLRTSDRGSDQNITSWTKYSLHHTYI